ncbi:MAG: hypothetical protein ABS944_08340 [Solibacillus sp.]|jgi:hypothetical protein|uniref:hypothetical protein n=1 Tax=unclassified Solibacillus TaxID=2637870 RepID=UPI0030F8CD4A
MKQTSSIFAALILALGIITSIPHPSSATTTQSDIVEMQVQSKKVVETVYYEGIISFPPKTIYYNKGGWTGTLNLGFSRFDHDRNQTVSQYSGIVSCTGNCYLPTSLTDIK